MHSFWKNYGSTLLLLAGLVIGGVLGVVLGEDAAVLRPVGHLFLNLVFVLVVPLVTIGVGVALSAWWAPGLGAAAMKVGNLIMWATELGRGNKLCGRFPG